jgi:hypothetical protein
MSGVPNEGANRDTLPAPWPTAGGRPLAFVGQIDLAQIDLARIDLARIGQLHLPAPFATGLLALYYDVERQPWGRHDGPGWHLEHVPAATATAPVPAPAGVPVLDDADVQTFEELTLPYPRTAAARSLELDGPRWEAYVEAWDRVANEVRRRPVEDGRVHRLFGHPDAIQGDMARRIVYERAGADLEQPEPELEDAAGELVLVLQVDSDHAALGSKAVWGNFGRLFVWAARSDLEAGDLSRCELQLQC